MRRQYIGDKGHTPKPGLQAISSEDTAEDLSACSKGKSNGRPWPSFTVEGPWPTYQGRSQWPWTKTAPRSIAAKISPHNGKEDEWSDYFHAFGAREA